jgi:disulfide bond formation protein DsbB
MTTHWRITVAAAIVAISLSALGCTTNSPASAGGSSPAATTSGAPGGAASAVALTAGNPTTGKTFFEQTCSACHGMDAHGVKGLGKNLTTSTFAKGLTDQQLVDFIKKGRDPSDPLNTTHVAMPPKGGNPAVTDQDLMNVVSYLRTLQKAQ